MHFPIIFCVMQMYHKNNQKKNFFGKHPDFLNESTKHHYLQTKGAAAVTQYELPV